MVSCLMVPSTFVFYTVAPGMACMCDNFSCDVFSLRIWERNFICSPHCMAGGLLALQGFPPDSIVGDCFHLYWAR